MPVNFEKSLNEVKFEEINQMLFEYWKNIAINIFEWKGLDEISPTLTSEIIEEELFDTGKSLFFNDVLLGYMSLKVAPSNKRNVYNRPESFRAIGLNYNKEYDTSNSVLIKNNSLGKATADIIGYYTKILADIELTKSLRLDAHKTPFVFSTTEDTLLTAKNIFKKIKAREPVIFKNKSKADVDVGIEILNADTPFINDKLDDEYHNYEARILTALGLDNYCEDKKERVQTAEVESQQEYIISSFRASLNERQKACEKINKMFGLNLSVDYVKNDEIETDENVSRETIDDENVSRETMEV